MTSFFRNVALIQSKNSAVFCGGTLVSNNIVITGKGSFANYVTLYTYRKKIKKLLKFVWKKFLKKF